MAQEGCNLNKDEAEVLKPSSPPPPNPSSSSQPTPAITTSSPSSSPPPPLLLRPTLEFSAQRPEKPEDSSQIPCNKHKAERCSQLVVKLGNRCSCCRKKVGLTGFRCRCGDLFCGRHRYSDTHDCSFDYKALGREEISKANPVIRAAKIIKI